MKRIAIILLIGIMVTIIVYGVYIRTTKTYTVEVTTQIEKPVEVDALTKRIDDAQKTQEVQINEEAQKAYEKTKTESLNKIELDVRTIYRKELEAKEVELKKTT